MDLQSESSNLKPHLLGARAHTVRRQICFSLIRSGSFQYFLRPSSPFSLLPPVARLPCLPSFLPSFLFPFFRVATLAATYEANKSHFERTNERTKWRWAVARGRRCRGGTEMRPLARARGHAIRCREAELVKMESFSYCQYTPYT